MRRIGMGLIGPGFVGAHHVDAVRRLGFVDVVAVAASTRESARKKADEYGVPKAYGSYEELIADPDIHVVHNTTPNYLHAPVNLAVIAKRKHIISDKPLALDSAEARIMWKAAQEAGIVHAVTFNYRGNPLVQEAREKIFKGELGNLSLFMEPICRIGCSMTPSTRGVSIQRKAARPRLWAISVPIGVTSHNTSPAFELKLSLPI